MRFHFTDPLWLVLLPPTLAWTAGLAWRSYASLAGWRRWVSALLRAAIVTGLVCALAGVRWERKQPGMTTMFLLDRSESIPPDQQEQARTQENAWVRAKQPVDQAGVVVFGADPALETSASAVAEGEKIQAVVNPERTDIGAAIRLGAAAFPEHGQKKLVLFSDGNENEGDALAAAESAHSQGISLDVVAQGAAHKGDAAIEKLSLPSNLGKGQAFDLKIVATSDQPRPAKLRLYRDGAPLGEQSVQLDAGKNLFALPQTLDQPGFHTYEARLEAVGDSIPQNNRAAGFTTIREGRNALLLSSDPEADATLAQAIGAKLTVRTLDARSTPDTLAELQAYDVIILANVAAGDLGRDRMRLLDSAVKDFGVGLICVGGDQAFAAGGYRRTPLEDLLPVDMELSSKKVLPKGALGMVMHGMEFANGNQVARQVALAALDALGPQDEMGVWLWDGTEKPLFELQPVGAKTHLAKLIAGMNQGDLPSFDGLMTMAAGDLEKSTANLKHLIVLSDGDPNAPGSGVMTRLAAARVTISTVMIGGHVQPTTMIKMAADGHGRFYEVRSAAQLPQIFIKEASVILKSAIIEEPFSPRIATLTEPIRGLGGYPPLLGYVATTAKPRAETPLLTDKADPLLAHWQYGLGRTVAFTSDARSKWARNWLGWGQYQQFWNQAANWALRRIDTANFNAEVGIDRGRGTLSVEALDLDGNYRNFLTLQAAVVSPSGQRQNVALEQSGPGRYEARFEAREVGSYLINLKELRDGQAVASQVVGASVNYSPEYNETTPNLDLLRRLAEAGGGRLLDPYTDNPFKIGRIASFQPHDLWPDFLRWIICLFVIDVAVRRVDFDREEWTRWWCRVLGRFGLGDRKTGEIVQQSLQTLLAARERARPHSILPEPPANPDANPARVSQPKKSAPTSEDKAAAAPPASEAIQKPETSAGPSDPRQRLLDAKRRARRQR